MSSPSAARSSGRGSPRCTSTARTRWTPFAEAAELIDAADLGDHDAEFALGSAEDFDLAWYAPGEIRYLVEELSDGR